MNQKKLIVHTDIILEYLLHHDDGASVLRHAMRNFFCYTTVFNAIELFSLARTASEREAVERSMAAMKILGLNAKSAKGYGAMLARESNLPRMNSLIAGLCLESRLPLLTRRPDEFRGIKRLNIVLPSDIAGVRRTR